MKIYSAPLQGFTESVWRNLHNEIFGGVDSYFTPFIRYEHGEIRNKDIRDIEKKNNTVPSLIPQLIAATPEEMRHLLQLIRKEGYTQADINMGCSFPLQARRKHGAGILPYPQMVSALMKEIEMHPDIKFSVKMRLGWESADEWKAIIDILNDAPLSHITMHPRLGREQYKKPADRNAFLEFYNECKHPLVYNGDIKTLADIKEIERQFVGLQGIMIGRGLLENPALALEYKKGTPLPDKDFCLLVRTMHDNFFRIMSMRLQGNTQLLSKIKPYWEYLMPQMEKRYRKAIQKSNTAEKYLQAVNLALESY